MDDLYRAPVLADPAQALAQAQRLAIARGTAPAHWAGFLLIRG